MSSVHAQHVQQDSAPRSLVARNVDHSKRDALLAKFSDTLYDVLTIFISIADITTDIMVLISYYQDGRMTFFWISLTILIAAQFGYIILFWWITGFVHSNFLFDKVVDYLEPRTRNCRGVKQILLILFVIATFVLCLPFGHLAAFVMYFAEDKKSSFAKWLKKHIGIGIEETVEIYDSMSKSAKFAAEKLNKHGGFIWEAFMEALPQSILQLIAMVYYKETRYIAVGSIILSMTSIMTKSLVISQGLDWNSYIWCWLCVCTDFFSIFFIVSWIFLSNEHIDSDFLGIFNIFGEIWCWKVMIAIVPFFVSGFVVYISFGFWIILYGIWYDLHERKKSLFALMEFVFITCGNALVVLSGIAISIAGILFMEIMCFSVSAFLLWGWCITDRWDKDSKTVSEALKIIFNFVGNASRKNNDRIIRILAVNVAYDETKRTYLESGSSHTKISCYIRKRESEKTLHEVTYSDIRDNCGETRDVYLFKSMKRESIETWKYAKKKIKCSVDLNHYHLYWENFLIDNVEGMMLLVLMVMMPIYLFSRIVSVFYPYFIIAYLSINDLWNEMALFELVMLWTYLGLQVLILLLGISVFRTHHWLWHVLPGFNTWNQQWRSDLKPFEESIYAFYDRVQWAPVVRAIIMREFGSDIGLIVMDYVDAIELEENP